MIKTRIVKIGNSQGVRIPRRFLAHVDLGEDVELVLQDDQLVIRPALPVRHGWEEAFRQMAKAGDDRLLTGDELL
jgi:antitoxin MazE